MQLFLKIRNRLLILTYSKFLLSRYFSSSFDKEELARSV